METGSIQLKVITDLSKKEYVTAWGDWVESLASLMQGNNAIMISRSIQATLEAQM
jgi:hypothetical protein